LIRFHDKNYPKFGRQEVVIDKMQSLTRIYHNKFLGEISGKIVGRFAPGNPCYPMLSFLNKKANNAITTEIDDKSPFIPNKIKGTILHPFFTSMKGLQETGLGLCINNIIVKVRGET